jgi:Transposase domain (DUF772)
MFSYISPEERVPQDHPLRTIRVVVDAVLKALSAQFDCLYSETGRPSIAPEKLLRALLLQVLYTMRSERLLRGQLSCRRRVQPGANAHTGGRGMSPRESRQAQSLLHLTALAPAGGATPREAPKILPSHSRSFYWHHCLAAERCFSAAC